MKTINKNLIKFPVLHGVDYIDLTRDKKTVLSIDGAELENLSWRELQLKIGEQLTDGRYNYSMKIKGDDVIHRGSIKAVSINKLGNKMNESNEITVVKKSIEDLNKKLSSLKGESPGVDLLMQMTRNGYESQISFLRDEIARKEKNIDKLDAEIEKLNGLLDTAEDVIEELKGKTGLNQYLQIAKEFLVMKSGNMKPVASLESSDPSDIPGEVLQVIGLIDWVQVDESLKSEIVNYLKIFVQKLPLKK